MVNMRAQLALTALVITLVACGTSQPLCLVDPMFPDRCWHREGNSMVFEQDRVNPVEEAVQRCFQINHNFRREWFSSADFDTWSCTLGQQREEEAKPEPAPEPTPPPAPEPEPEQPPMMNRHGD